ncbi:MAG: phosphonate metabolism transcriptional regulator PhnF [Solirubrobacteraceae bacterium]
MQSVFAGAWTLDRQSSVPAYEQIAQRASALIESGRLRVGDRLPAERDLASWVGVSRMTARAALASLAHRGLVERDVGRGTFVASAKLEHDLGNFRGFTDMIRRQGRSPKARIRSLERTSAPEPVAGMLEVAPGAQVFRIQRLRFADDEPVTLEDSWIPADRFPDLLDQDLRGSLYELMRDVYAASPARAQESLEAVLADAVQASALNVAVGSALMLVTRVARARDGLPVEFARDHHRGDRARFTVELATNLRPRAE